MPELPEVECLIRHLKKALPLGPLEKLVVHKPRLLRLDRTFDAACPWTDNLTGHHLNALSRHGKYWIMHWSKAPAKAKQIIPDTLHISGHLGMTGRLYIQKHQDRPDNRTPEHTVAEFIFPDSTLYFRDPRQFGMMICGQVNQSALSPDPLTPDWLTEPWPASFTRSKKALKVCLLDQSIAAGVGNIYASEVLFESGIHPHIPPASLDNSQMDSLRMTIRTVLQRAVDFGSSLQLNFSGEKSSDRLFYFGSASGAARVHEFFNVYDRDGDACRRCGTTIEKIIQTGRSTFFCPVCQKIR